MNSTFLDFHLFPVPEDRPSKFFTKGLGEKGIWIWYHANQAEQSEMESFLGNIFSAAQIDLAQDTRCGCLTKQETFSFSQLEGGSSAEFVFLFGIDAKQIGLHFYLQPYHPVSFNGTVFVLADAIADIFEERQAGKKEKSGQLWRILKSCFKI